MCVFVFSRSSDFNCNTVAYCSYLITWKLNQEEFHKAFFLNLRHKTSTLAKCVPVSSDKPTHACLMATVLLEIHGRGRHVTSYKYCECGCWYTCYLSFCLRPGVYVAHSAAQRFLCKNDEHVLLENRHAEQMKLGVIVGLVLSNSIFLSTIPSPLCSILFAFGTRYLVFRHKHCSSVWLVVIAMTHDSAVKLSTHTGPIEDIKKMLFLFFSTWLFVTAWRHFLYQKTLKQEKSEEFEKYFRRPDNRGCLSNSSLWLIGSFHVTFWYCLSLLSTIFTWWKTKKVV